MAEKKKLKLTKCVVSSTIVMLKIYQLDKEILHEKIYKNEKSLRLNLYFYYFKFQHTYINKHE